jgi:urease accessory protein UreF
MTDPEHFTTEELAAAFANLGHQLCIRLLAELKSDNAERFANARRLIEAGQRTQVTALFEAEPGAQAVAIELALRSDLDEATPLWRLIERRR